MTTAGDWTHSLGASVLRLRQGEKEWEKEGICKRKEKKHSNQCGGGGKRLKSVGIRTSGVGVGACACA